MGTPYMGEIKLISWNFAPQGWSFANGQFLPINQNQALFSLLGTYYGGNGQTTFALPDMRGRTPIHMGSGFVIGQAGGEPSHTVSQSEMPQHIHVLNCSTAVGNAVNPRPLNSSGTLFAQDPGKAYSSAAQSLTALAPGTVSNTGGSQPHENRQPLLAINFIVALQGIFPSPT
jgi:microcystin-dependent protein